MFFRLFLSYQLKERLSKQNMSINALNRSIIILTILYRPIFQQGNIMSMPFFGLLNFLHMDMLNKAYGILCQCPSSGFFTFYINWYLYQSLWEAKSCR